MAKRNQGGKLNCLPEAGRSGSSVKWVPHEMVDTGRRGLLSSSTCSAQSVWGSLGRGVP